MMQVLGLGVPMLELFMRFVIWLYMIPLTFAMIGAGFFRDSLVVLVFRRDLRQAGRFALEGVIGFAMAAAIFSLIYFRKELLQCVFGH